MSRVYIVTGSNIGLGYHAALSLAAMKAGIVVLACRNTVAAMAAAESIRKEAGCGEEGVVALSEPLDLSDLESVRTYAAALKKWIGGRRIAALINNAGVGGDLSFPKNKEGNDLVFTTNHLGHFLLTLLLLPLIDDRIVNVSSEVHNHESVPHLPDASFKWPTNDSEYETLLLRGEPLEGENPFVSGMRRYCRSKLCNVFFTNELAFKLSGDVPSDVSAEVAAVIRELPGSASNSLPAAKKLRVVSFNPGLMLDTNFIADERKKRYDSAEVQALKRTGPVSGSRLARLALGEIEGTATAAFFSDEASHPTSMFSRSLGAATEHQKELWNHSLRWARVTPDELVAAGF